ncbi:MAG: hypothetical protein J6P46_07385 [Bacteroidales bacterium]|nr:hypothetical protein [Bacteroidales bacterium]
MEENTYVLIDRKTLEEHLGTAADEDPGEKVPIIDFLQEVNGKILPDLAYPKSGQNRKSRSA